MDATLSPSREETRLYRQRMLTVAILVSIFLFIVHLADDMARGIEAGDLQDLIGGTAITVAWLYLAMVFRGRLVGFIAALVGGVFSLLVPYAHMRGNGIGEIARSTGGIFFALTLLIMALTGAFTIALSLHGFRDLVRSRSTQN